ncbi:MAG: hypothetical protein WCT46_06830 [Candidatus Gracilibacteria bacterium]|jgi:type II pantothenate kinase
MKFISLDFGGSTVDAVLWDGDLIKSIKTYESKDVAEFCIRKTVYNKRPSGVLEKFLKFSGISLKGVKRIFVTGGKSRFFPDEVRGIKVQRVSEIEAIGEGARHRQQRAEEVKRGPSEIVKIVKLVKRRREEEWKLVVSMGTGTCMVSVKGDKIKHVGGTGVGGGTFVGLGRELLDVSDINELLKIAKGGLSKNVDVSVSEIVGGSIGRVSGEATASNFGKLRDEIKFKKEDLAAGIINLIGQTIGISAVFAAQAEGVGVVVLTGKLTRACAVTDVVRGIIEGYGLKVSVPKNAEYVAAIGAKVAGERSIR